MNSQHRESEECHLLGSYTVLKTSNLTYENLFGGKDPNSGQTNGFSIMTMPLCTMNEEFTSSWLRSLIQNWIIHFIHEGTKIC
jgi:hypothetical protein